MGIVKTGGESIRSDDEGPEDFTLNMEKWMRGNEKWRKAGGQEGDEYEQEEGEAGHDVEEEEEEEKEKEEEVMDAISPDQEDFGEESEFVPLSTSTPATFGKTKKILQDRKETLENDTPRPPPLSRLNTELLQNKATEEVLEQISSLEAEVQRLRLESENDRLSNIATERQKNQVQAENDDMIAELLDIRNEVTKLQKQAKLADDALALERQNREDSRSKVGSLRAKFEPMAQELAIARSTADAEKQANEARIETLESKLLGLHDENAKQQREVETCQHAQSTELKSLKSELDVCKVEIKAYQQTLGQREENYSAVMTNLNKKIDITLASESKTAALKMELDHAHKQLTEIKRTVDGVEDENDCLRQENERQRKEIADLETSVDVKDALIKSAEIKISDLRDEISSIQAEKNAGTMEEGVREAEMEDLRKQHRTTLLDAKLAHDQQLKTLKTTISRAGDGMRKREARLQKGHQEELSSLKKEIIALKARHDCPPESPPPSDQELRNAIHMLATRLGEAKSNLASTRQALTSTKASLANTQTKMEDLRQRHQKVKDGFEEKWKAKCQERDGQWKKSLSRYRRDKEAEWEKKVEELKVERRKILRELLMAWGREEMGPAKEGEKQAYRYKYIKKVIGSDGEIKYVEKTPEEVARGCKSAEKASEEVVQV